jgi:methyl-accepting chemotaxis protein
MDTFLQRLGLSQQIAFVGMLGVIGLIVVGGIYGLGNARQMTAQQRVDRANESIDALDAIKIDLLEARRSEKDFLLRRKDEYADKQNAAVAAASKDLKILRRLVDPQNQAAVDRAVAQVGRYADQFSAVSKIAHTVGLDENSGLEGTLRGSVHGIEELLGGGTVSQISDANAHLNAAMLMMRRPEKDFFARLRPTYLDQMKKAAEDFQQILGQSSMPSDRKSEVTQARRLEQRCHRHADNRPGNVGNGRGDEPAGDGGCLGFGGSIRQCPIGRVGRGRIIEHGCRNHPAGLAIRRCRTQGSR